MRTLKLAARGAFERIEGAETALTLGEAGDARTVRVPTATVDALVRRGALRRDGDRLARTAAGASALRRLLAEPDTARDERADGGTDGGLDADARTDPHAEQHRARVRDAIAPDGAAGRPEPVSRNALESPLDRLAAARERDGTPFLHPEMVEAGRRLRSDFERGAMRARITMAWEAPVSSGSGAGGGAGGADLTDSAMAARERYARAVGALGPRLGPALADFVAHEMGLADVERGRGWPARSGKMMLREALDRLAAHYRGGR